MRIAVIGSGVSGIAAAKVLARLGHEVIIFEKAAQIGGIWVLAYPEVRLQNVAEHYRFTDFDWPFEVDEHPTPKQVLAYLEAAIAHFGLDVRLNHQIVALKAVQDGWQVEINNKQGELNEHFDRVIVATGLFSGEQAHLSLSGAEQFEGQVLDERSLEKLPELKGKRLTVVGFGKTAVDLASMAAQRGAKVHHVFRAPRWLLPRRVLGRNLADMAASRMSTIMLPSWVHSDRSEAIMHKYFSWSVTAYWKGTEWLFKSVLGLHPFYLSAKKRTAMAALSPDQSLTYQMRAAAALAPDPYFSQVRQGAITPRRGEVTGFSKTGIVLGDGGEVDADIVLMAVGYKPPKFAYLPAEYRDIMTGQPDGTQLYRHVVHPRIPNLAFAGFNHCYLHIAGVEIAMLWYGAVIEGKLALPQAKDMEAVCARVSDWKRKNSLIEPTRAYGVGGRFHHYIDVLLMELGVKAKRKSNPLSEHLLPYWARDYAGIFEEYELRKGQQETPLKTLPFDA